jgi:hypothetical protein
MKQRRQGSPSWRLRGKLLFPLTLRGGGGFALAAAQASPPNAALEALVRIAGTWPTD